MPMDLLPLALKVGRGENLAAGVFAEVPRLGRSFLFAHEAIA